MKSLLVLNANVTLLYWMITLQELWSNDASEAPPIVHHFVFVIMEALWTAPLAMKLPICWLRKPAFQIIPDAWRMTLSILTLIVGRIAISAIPLQGYAWNVWAVINLHMIQVLSHLNQSTSANFLVAMDAWIVILLLVAVPNVTNILTIPFSWETKLPRPTVVMISHICVTSIVLTVTKVVYSCTLLCWVEHARNAEEGIMWPHKRIACNVLVCARIALRTQVVAQLVPTFVTLSIRILHKTSIYVLIRPVTKLVCFVTSKKAWTL